jgi:hypothetical protein
MKEHEGTGPASPGRSRDSSGAHRVPLLAGLFLLALTLCLIGAAQVCAAKPISANQADLARPAVQLRPLAVVAAITGCDQDSDGDDVVLGTPSAKSPKGTTTPLRPMLKWSTVSGASWYDIQIFQRHTLKRAINGRYGTSLHITKSLPANVALTWRVRARNNESTGAWSRSMKFVISPPKPKSPDGAITSVTPSLQWDKLRGATRYECSISGGGVHLTKSGLTTASYTFGQALPANVPLTWKVRGSNSEGKGVWSRSIAFVVAPDHPSLTIIANDQSKTYGAMLPLGDSAFTTVGLLPGDSVTSVTLSSAGAAASATASRSPYAIVPSAAGGAGLDKYAITYVNGSLTVGRRALTIGGATANDKFYDGTTTATVDFSGASLIGAVDGDAVTIAASGCSANFASATIGTATTVTVTGVTLGGLDAGNYTVSQPAGLSADIIEPIVAVSSETAPLQGPGYSSGCFIPSGTATGDLVFALVQARNSWLAVPPLGSTVGDWTKVRDYSYTGPAYGTPYYYYYALYYLQVGATVPWHDTWDFPTSVYQISVTNVTYRGATYDTASTVPYITNDTSLTAGSVTTSTAGEGLLFVGGAFDPAGIGTVSVSGAPAGFTTSVDVSSNNFMGYFALADDPQTSAAPSGARTATLTVSTDLKQAWLVALKP